MTGREILASALRAIVMLLISAGTLLLLSAIIGKFDIPDYREALLIALVVTVVNVVLWPLLASFALRFVVVTAGIGTILLNGLILMVAAGISEDITIGFWSAVLAAFLMTVVSVIATTVLGLGERDLYYSRVVLPAIRRAARHQGRTVHETDVPGVFFLEIDGLAEDVLRRAIANGHAPTMARWMHEGTHRIVGWECDLSSQTSASQAGLLQGSNHGIPAFRWYEKDSGKLMASSDPGDVATIEERLSNGNGLLAQGGTSRGNLMSGDAPRNLMTLSKVKQKLYSRDFYAYFADPYNPPRTLALALFDIFIELKEAGAQRRNDVRPRIKRGGVYPFLRVAMTVVMRDLNIFSLVGDMFEGVPVSYATFVGYDEVAHHSGVERRDALDVLRRLDRQFAWIERVSRLAPRPYKFVVLSDHGQSQGATFLQRYGETLEDVVKGAVEDDGRVRSVAAADEAWGNIGGAVTQAAHSSGKLTSRAVRAVTRGRTEDDSVALGPERERRAVEDEIEQGEGTGTIVLASGCLGLVYLLESDRRMSWEEIERAHPRLIETLVQHPGVGFAMVGSHRRGPVVIGKGGMHHLADGRIEGDDPLAPFGRHAARHLKRTDGFEHVPDILVNSTFFEDADEVAAFEELVGSHGGLGGMQSRPFALVPSEWSPEPGEIVGAGRMHEVLMGWLAETGTIRVG